MKNKKLLLCFPFLFLFSTVFAQNFYGYQFKKHRYKVVIPFEIQNNLIIISVKMNGVPMNFLLDTGVENTILVNESYAASMLLHHIRTIDLLGADKNKLVKANLVHKVKMEIGDKVFTNNERVLILEEDFLEFHKIFEKEIHGIIGFELFRSFVVKINFISKQLVLYQSDHFKTPKSSKYTDYDIELNHGKPNLLANITLDNNDTIQGSFLLDTGASFDFLLNINSDKKINYPTKTITDDMGRGLGGLMSGKIGKVKTIAFSPFEFAEVVTFFQNDTAFDAITNIKNRNGIIGNGLMSRFNIIFDYRRNVVYFQKNKTYKKPFAFNRSGIILHDVNNFELAYPIKEILSGSPAAEAGILPGDYILKVNNLSGSTLTLTAIKNAFKAKAGKKLSLWLIRDDQVVSKSITLRELI